MNTMSIHADGIVHISIHPVTGSIIVTANKKTNFPDFVVIFKFFSSSFDTVWNFFPRPLGVN